MIWREMMLIKNGQVVAVEHSHPFVPEVQKIKNLTFEGIKKFGYVIVFLTLKSFMKSSNFIKNKSKSIIKEVQDRLSKNKNINFNELTEKKEISKYLKIISEYRQKIRKIKHRIKEEEGIE
jgi:hypothetical protein